MKKIYESFSKLSPTDCIIIASWARFSASLVWDVLWFKDLLTRACLATALASALIAGWLIISEILKEFAEGAI